MLIEALEQLDEWITAQNVESLKSGTPAIKHCQVKVIGQTALLEAKLGISIAATMDVDVFNPLENSVREKLEEILRNFNKSLDRSGHEAWMPNETKYLTIYTGTYAEGMIAEPVFVILSKAKVAAEKNKNLIAEYLASEDLDQRIFELADKYNVNLESFV